MNALAAFTVDVSCYLDQTYHHTPYRATIGLTVRINFGIIVELAAV